MTQTSLPEPLQAFADLTAPMSAALASLDAMAGEFRRRRTAGLILPNTLESLRVELTYHSNAIEGSTLSLRETQLVIEGRTPAGERSLREIYEARNHDRALRTVERWAIERPADPLTEQDILTVHAQIMQDIDDRSGGQRRTERVRIVGSGYVPPGSQKFDALIPAMIQLANGAGRHPLLTAAELHYNLVAVHPFNDGNERTARLMMNHHLLRHGYPYAMVEMTRRGEYLAAIDDANRGHLLPFAQFIADSVGHTAGKLLL